MKIEINLDIEAIVREAIRNNALADNIIINTKTKDAPKGITWEFGPQPGRRRNTEEIALHELELKHARLLTPEEKGEAKAFVEIDETTEKKAKENTLTKIRIDDMVTEGVAAASKELAEEEQKGSQDQEEATIPKAEELKTDSLFGTKL